MCVWTAGAAAQAPRYTPLVPAPRPSGVSVPATGIAFLASAAVPGAGQLYLGEQRWVAYLAVETWSWVTYSRERSRARSLERDYRDLAWRVARRVDAVARRDTSFAYYEAMADTRWHESGAFDADPREPGIQPELDTLTYNGRQWQLAREQYLPRGQDLPPGTREYERALEYYRANAIPRGYGWSWGQSNLEQQVFGRMINESDDAFRSATRTLGLILANHVVSAIDALVTARLQAAAEGGRQLRIGSELSPAGGSMLWTTTVRFPVGN